MWRQGSPAFRATSCGEFRPATLRPEPPRYPRPPVCSLQGPRHCPSKPRDHAIDSPASKSTFSPPIHNYIVTWNDGFGTGHGQGGPFPATRFLIRSRAGARLLLGHVDITLGHHAICLAQSGRVDPGPQHPAAGGALHHTGAGRNLQTSANLNFFGRGARGRREKVPKGFWGNRRTENTCQA